MQTCPWMSVLRTRLEDMSFKNEPIFTLDRHGPGGILSAPVLYEHGRYRFEIPRGFKTDLASTRIRVPWWLFPFRLIAILVWVFFPPWGEYNNAAILHDFLYATQPVTRKEADVLFFVDSVESGEKIERAYAMYRALRLFGWIAWRKHRRKARK